MNPQDFQASIDEHNSQQQEQADKQAQLDAVKNSGEQVSQAVNDSTNKTTQALKDVKGEVKVTNPDLAKSQDVDKAVEAINKLNLTTFMSNEGLPQLAKNLSDLSGKTQDLQDKMENEGLKKMSDQLGMVVKKLDDVSKTLSKSQVTVEAKLQKTIDNLSASIGKIDFNPSVNVSAPDTKVVTTPVDLSSISKGLADVVQAIKDSETPETEQDISPITMGLDAVKTAITALRFPASNYVLPFRNQDGKATQLQLDASGNLPTVTGLSVPTHDSITLSYTGSNLTGVVYKLGAKTVTTLTLAYDGSNNLTSVVKT